MTDPVTDPAPTLPSRDLAGVKIWLVTDGTLAACGVDRDLVAALRAAGATSVDEMGTAGAIGHVARDLLDAGADAVTRTWRLLRGASAEAVEDSHFQRARPDLLLSDHARGLSALTTLRDTMRSDALVIGLALEPGRVARQNPGQADGWVALAGPDSRALAASRAIPDAVIPVRPPVRSACLGTFDREATRAQMGLPPSVRLIVVDALATSPLAAERLLLAARGRPDRVIAFWYGADEEVAGALRQSAAALGVAAGLFGGTTGVEAWFAAADAVLVERATLRAAGYLATGARVGTLDVGMAEPMLDIGGELVVHGDLDALIGWALTREPSEPLPRRTDTGVSELVSAIGTHWSRRATLVRPAPVPARPPPTGPLSPDGRMTGVPAFERIGARTLEGTPVAALSRDEAKRLLSELIIEERRNETEQARLLRERDRWFERLALAEADGAAELVAWARGQVDNTSGDLVRIQQRQDAIREEKERIRERVVGARTVPTAPSTADASGDMERRFRDLERRRDMDRLRGGGGGEGR